MKARHQACFSPLTAARNGGFSTTLVRDSFRAALSPPVEAIGISTASWMEECTRDGPSFIRRPIGERAGRLSPRAAQKDPAGET